MNCFFVFGLAQLIALPFQLVTLPLAGLVFAAGRGQTGWHAGFPAPIVVFNGLVSLSYPVPPPGSPWEPWKWVKIRENSKENQTAAFAFENPRGMVVRDMLESNKGGQSIEHESMQRTVGGN